MAGHKGSLSLLLFLCMFIFCIDQISSINEQGGAKKKLFLFGDSVLDTGNGHAGTGGWNSPYGQTFPGHPTGRFSDGLCLTDYLASFLGIDTPTPSTQKDAVDKTKLQNGMNFAVGGSGVFSVSWMQQVNLLTQINELKHVIDQNVYTPTDLESSVAFVHTSGNDYADYGNNHTQEELRSYVPTVVKQLSADLQNLHDLGVPKVLVCTMPAAGCSPQFADKSAYFPQNCNQTTNSFIQVHNQLVKEAVEKLNRDNQKQVFVLIDMYNAFLSAMDEHAKTTDNSVYKNQAIECCKGASAWSCGMLDAAGKPDYKVCEHPEMSFYWDMAHPSQHGASFVYSALKDSLKQFF